MYIHTSTHTYTHNGILLSHKKNEIISFATIWMDLENIIPSGISQSYEILYDIIYMWNFQNNINDHICKTETDSHI